MERLSQLKANNISLLKLNKMRKIIILSTLVITILGGIMWTLEKNLPAVLYAIVASVYIIIYYKEKYK